MKERKDGTFSFFGGILSVNGDLVGDNINDAS
ncbi:MAG: hypothetical protein ACI9LN_001991 [Saprospiraceae bacterium]|jgi:hypothetical protein